jgi:hypothetical protein
MSPLEVELFRAWMEAYGKASRENDPQASANLFAQDALYYESPFEEPLLGREDIYEYWRKGSHNLRDKQSIYEILAVRDHLGIARWQAQFTVIESGKHFVLDCIFVVEFNEDGLCQTFREWWHIRDGNPKEQ